MDRVLKEIGAPDAVICDAARKQISKEVWHFCHQIGTTLRVLEENTPWANRAKLCLTGEVRRYLVFGVTLQD